MMISNFKTAATTLAKKANSRMLRIGVRVNQMMGRTRNAMLETDGAMYVDEGGNMLIAAVVGMLLLVSIYSLFKTGVIPNVNTKTSAMFTYSA
ncbi:DUF6133 family protein [Ethanoligenens sp.]|uniref:DUF6133 family protein n=1 Tax=Ethanoligenens sp. TaxID=2099655 RepID=UPI0039E9512C